MNAQLQRNDLFTGETAEQYHVRRLGELSNSGIQRLLRSPAHYRAWCEAEDTDTDTPALAFGRAFHCALLEPERFATTYAVEPDFGDCRFKANKEARDAWRAQHADAEPLSDTDATRIARMLDAIRAHPLASRAIRNGVAEATLRWRDETTGVACKARADYFVDGKLPFVLDVKTTDDASPEAFVRSVHKYGYHVQHAHYCEGFRVLGRPLSNYLLLAVEKSPPYAVALYHVDAAAEQLGYARRSRAAASLRHCIDNDTWPAYGEDITPLSLPAWATKEIED